jgi:predicted amidophosphoribosyltransferase
MGKQKDRALIRKVVQRLPECAFCSAPATCSERVVSGTYVGREFQQSYCDEHAQGRPAVVAFTYAEPLRQLLERMEQWD